MSKLPTNYTSLLKDIKKAIQTERSQAIQRLTRSLINIYWEIGKLIVENRERDGWGKSVVEELSKDLQKEFPGQTGYSPRNLWFMRQFYETYYADSNMKQLVSEIPWAIIY